MNYVQSRIRALKYELQELRQKATLAKPSRAGIRKRILVYRELVERTSRALKVTSNPDTYIAELRAKNY